MASALPWCIARYYSTISHAFFGDSALLTRVIIPPRTVWRRFLANIPHTLIERYNCSDFLRKDKTEGRNLLQYGMQAVSHNKKILDRGIIKPSQLGIMVKTQQDPNARLIEMLRYKSTLVGIKVVLTEESYTSQASFLDRDKIPVYDPKHAEKLRFSGKRVKRGLYRASDGRLINADINGAGNVIRKGAPDAFGSKGVEECVVSPVRIVVPVQNKQKGKRVE